MLHCSLPVQVHTGAGYMYMSGVTFERDSDQKLQAMMCCQLSVRAMWSLPAHAPAVLPACRLGGAVAPFIIYAGQQLGHPKLPFAVVGGLSAFTAVLTAFLPETRGKRQPDTMMDLHRMYGRASSTNSSGGAAGHPGCGRCQHHSVVDAGEQLQCGSGLDEGEPGLLQRLLSRTASSGSWIAAAVRTRSSSSFSRASCQSGSVMLDRGASSSELVAIVSEDSQRRA